MIPEPDAVEQVVQVFAKQRLSPAISRVDGGWKPESQRLNDGGLGVFSTVCERARLCQEAILAEMNTLRRRRFARARFTNIDGKRPVVARKGKDARRLFFLYVDLRQPSMRVSEAYRGARARQLREASGGVIAGFERCGAVRETKKLSSRIPRARQAFAIGRPRGRHRFPFVSLETNGLAVGEFQFGNAAMFVVANFERAFRVARAKRFQRAGRIILEIEGDAAHAIGERRDALKHISRDLPCLLILRRDERVTARGSAVFRDHEERLAGRAGPCAFARMADLETGAAIFRNVDVLVRCLPRRNGEGFFFSRKRAHELDRRPFRAQRIPLETQRARAFRFKDAFRVEREFSSSSA